MHMHGHACIPAQCGLPVCTPPRAAQSCPHSPWGRCPCTSAVTAACTHAQGPGWHWGHGCRAASPPSTVRGAERATAEPPTAAPRAPRGGLSAALSSWSFNEVNCLKSSVCPKCPSLREAAAAPHGRTPERDRGCGRAHAPGPGTWQRQEEEDEGGLAHLQSFPSSPLSLQLTSAAYQPPISLNQANCSI